MDPISLEDLALLEVLRRVDEHVVLTDSDSAIRTRMIEGGLIHDDDEDGLSLTAAGIELCKSLQHRVAADAQAARILQQRESVESSDGVSVDA
jgi:hypothetical protein